MIKDFKLENIICFNSSIIKHSPSLSISQLTPLTPHSCTELSNFGALEALGGGLQMFFELQKQRSKV